MKKNVHDIGLAVHKETIGLASFGGWFKAQPIGEEILACGRMRRSY
jgi:hypothetical protein